MRAAPARTSLVVLVTALALAPAVARAKPGFDPAKNPGTADRTLGGHVFTPSLLVRSPFAVTSFEASLLYGAGDASGPTYDTDSGVVIGEEKYSFAAMGQTFAYDKKLYEGISAGLGAVTQLYSGIDGPSAVVVGAEIGFGAFGRLTAGHRFGPVHAAATFDASYAPRLGIVVIDAIARAIQGSGVDAGAAFTQENAWTLRPGLAAAVALHRALGITASADWQWIALDTDDDRSVTEAGVDLALAADLDLGELTSVPVAVLAAYRLTAPVGGNGVSRVIDASGGVFYTGRPALVLGLEVGFRSFSVRALDADAAVAQIRLQYLW
jgi:hypothetical protein